MRKPKPRRIAEWRRKCEELETRIEVLLSRTRDYAEELAHFHNQRVDLTARLAAAEIRITRMEDRWLRRLDEARG